LDYNNGIIDSPIVDSSVGMVYAFAGQDNSKSCALPPSSTGGPCAGVYQFSTSSLATPAEAQVGAGSQFMMSGAFDNAYFTTGTGNLYVVGNTGPANNTLFQIPIASGAMGTTSNAGPVVSNNYTNGYYAAGLQVTEYLNGPGTDYLFLSVLAFGNPTGSTFCGATPQSVNIGCIMGFYAPSGTISSSAAPTGASAAPGGTSGIVVDFVPGSAGSVYYSTLLNQSSCTGGTGGCAIQILQSAP
jgi:hypothetical protein